MWKKELKLTRNPLSCVDEVAKRKVGKSKPSNFNIFTSPRLDRRRQEVGKTFFIIFKFGHRILRRSLIFDRFTSDSLAVVHGVLSWARGSVGLS